MNVFDLILLVVLALFTAIGVWRGLVRELISLLTWALACVAAWTFAGSLASAFETITREGELRQMLAFVVIFVVVFVCGMVIGFLLHRLVNRTAGLRMVNRATGGAVGLVRGAAILVILFLLAGLTSFPQRSWWRDALLAAPFERVATFAKRYLPLDVARHVRYG